MILFCFFPFDCRKTKGIRAALSSDFVEWLLHLIIIDVAIGAQWDRDFVKTFSLNKVDSFQKTEYKDQKN